VREPRKSINKFKHLNLSINNKQTNQQNNTNYSDSITEVHLLGSPRKSVSFKCNEKLWKTFVFEIKAQGLSVCHVLEPMIYGWLTAKVHLSHTIKPIKIDNIIVERAVKRVRRYSVEPESVAECELRSKRWYCSLSDEHVPVDSLPLSWCFNCPNRGCKDFVLKAKRKEE
jgi:hypothetical protein